MLDNRFALLFIRGERPVMDEKYDILRHPHVKLTTDGSGEPYQHGEVDRAIAAIMPDGLPYISTKKQEPPEESDYELFSDEEFDEYYYKLEEEKVNENN